MTKANEQVMTFTEFEIACQEEGHPLYSSFTGKVRDDVIEYFYHALTLKVFPKDLYPRDTIEGWDHSNVVRLTKREWHGLYAEALGELIEKKTR